MIEMPRRSVTRFFIPLIDVLILLFCIFLLMPIVNEFENEDPGGEDTQTGTDTETSPRPKSLQDLQRELTKAKAKIKELSRPQASLGDRLKVQVLEIDRTNGDLFYIYEGQRKNILTERDAQLLITWHKQRSGSNEVFFLILFPRDLREISGFPLETQVSNYRNWFKDVPYGFDVPHIGGTP